MDKRKNYYCVLDVETAGTTQQPLVYDLGFVICDKQGNIYEERSFIISEIFENGTLMDSAYYANKIPKYKADIAEGKRKVVSWFEARWQLLYLMKKYDVKVISAYNLIFDRRALRHTHEVLTGKKFFFPYDMRNIEELCIWSFACEVIYTQKTFQRVAVEQGWVSPCGNLRTSAEVGWKYLSGNYDFEEEHTGLEDVKIEVAILTKCYAQHKKHDSGVLGNPWRIPNRAEYKEVRIS